MNVTRNLNELPPSKAWLVVHGGINDGRTYNLKTERVTIGSRRSQQDFFTLDGDQAISRDHVRLKRHGEHYQLTDLGSRNGTLVNGKSIHTCLLRDNDIIRIGSTTLVYKYIPASLA